MCIRDRVDQASKNVWERERETIQEKVDELKEQPQLDNREFEEFKLLKMALLHIAAIGADDPEQAKAAVRRVRRAAVNGYEKNYRQVIAELEQQGKGKPSVKSFYVNDRIVMLDESAEIQRVSRDTLDRPEIFLARRQPLPWGNTGKAPDDPGYSADEGTVPTPWKDSLLLFLMGATGVWTMSGRLIILSCCCCLNAAGRCGEGVPYFACFDVLGKINQAVRSFPRGL